MDTCKFNSMIFIRTQILVVTLLSNVCVMDRIFNMEDQSYAMGKTHTQFKFLIYSYTDKTKAALLFTSETISVGLCAKSCSEIRGCNSFVITNGTCNLYHGKLFGEYPDKPSLVVK